jgi:hypothetical protein
MAEEITNLDPQEGLLDGRAGTSLKAHKAEILASLRPGTMTKRTIMIDPTSPLANFDWETTPGFFPGGPPIVRNGVHRRRESCTCRRSWRHVWGEDYCSDCWPCTDPLARVEIIHSAYGKWQGCTCCEAAEFCGNMVCVVCYPPEERVSAR